LLVDTIDTLESGLPNAIRVFEELRQKGHEPVGIRLDSGDLAFLSIQAAKMLDEAGFEDTTIVLSNNLDELVIWQVLTQITQEAPAYGLEADHLIKRLAFGVGTRLITSWGEPALGGVYKLVSVQDGGEWIPAIKISESSEKTPNPGNKRLWRLYDDRGKATADLVALAEEAPGESEELKLHHPHDPGRQRTLPREAISEVESLLEIVMVEGERRYPNPSLEDMRRRRQWDVERLDPGVRRLVNPHRYHVSVSSRLWDLRQQLIEGAMRGQAGSREGGPQ
jgi:nicotinate phosphoribosyltransferase